MDKLNMHTANLADENYKKLAALFPNAVTEAIDPETGEVVRAIDKDVLMQEISARVVEGREERYQFTWPDKKKAMLAANAPIAATLRPVDGGVNRDGSNCIPGGVSDSENLYIEGDNLDVLKLLQETYLRKVKMIYIDPPYNTGNDFVYEDDFAEDADEYLARSGQFDDQGNRLEQNTESNGRFHTDWLNMIYPRLKLAKNLLTDDGVIFMSIDDNEVDNLRKCCDEIFGEGNFLASIIWEKTRKNDARFFSTGHEYMIVYAKNQSYLIEQNTYFREEKEGAEDIYSEYIRLQKLYGNDFDKIQSELQRYYLSLPKDHPAKKHMRYNKVDEYGVWRDDNMSWPGGGGPTYDVIHPKTGKPCAVPPGGWRYSTPQKMQEMIRQGKVIFRDDETMPPIKKTYLVRKPGKNANDVDETVGKQVMGTYFYKSYLQSSTVMENLIGKGIFEYSKDHVVIKRMIAYVTTQDSIIVDFFSGSATTAHAVMQLNAEDGGHRKFIMVQLPEKTDESSEAYKAGYPNICEIGKERIRRAGRKIRDEFIMRNSQCAIDTNNSEFRITHSELSDLDIGFRVLRLDSSNMQDVYYNPAAMTQDLLSVTTDNIKPDRTPEDLLFQVMLDLGVELSSPIAIRNVECGMRKKDDATQPAIPNSAFRIPHSTYTYYDVADGFLIACFDKGITSEVVTEIAKRQPYYAVFRDSSMADDSTATNFDQIFETYSHNTVRKVL